MCILFYFIFCFTKFDVKVKCLFVCIWMSKIYLSEGYVNNITYITLNIQQHIIELFTLIGSPVSFWGTS